MSITFADRLTMQNIEIHRELDKTREELPRLFVQDIVDTVNSGERYRHPEDMSKRTKREIRRLRELVERKKRMDF